MSGQLNVETGVVLTEEPPVVLEGGPVSGWVNWLVREPNRLSLHVETDRPALLVLAENWFPAWKATVNGVEAPVLRANHTLRAIPVPEGESEVALTYSSGSLRFGLLVSLLSLLILGTGALLARRGGSGEASQEAKVKKVRDVMTQPVTTVEEDTPIAEMARLMVDKDIHRFPVMRAKELVGIVTRHDLLKLLVG